MQLSSRSFRLPRRWWQAQRARAGKHVFALEPRIGTQQIIDRVTRRQHAEYVLDGQAPASDNRLTAEDLRIDRDALEKLCFVHAGIVRPAPSRPLERRPLRVVKLHAQRILLRRSAMRVCQPGPVAFHRSITSTGSRREMSFRGLAERGRPPLFTTARRRFRLVSSGSSLYSCDRIA